MKQRTNIQGIERPGTGSMLWMLLGAAFFTLYAFTSCADFFETELNGVAGIDGRKVQSERDAFYQLNGILQLMQQVGDGYVIAGELRGDLVSQTDNSTQDFAISSFSKPTALIRISTSAVSMPLSITAIISYRHLTPLIWERKPIRSSAKRNVYVLGLTLTSP